MPRDIDAQLYLLAAQNIRNFCSWSVLRLESVLGLLHRYGIGTVPDLGFAPFPLIKLMALILIVIDPYYWLIEQGRIQDFATGGGG